MSNDTKNLPPSADTLHACSYACERPGCIRAQRDYLASKLATEGEEILVNTAHDVYTLPLKPSGLSSGPRFVVHVPGPEQPAAVDGEMMERIAALLYEETTGESWTVDDVYHSRFARAYYLRLAHKVAALAAHRKGGSDNE